MSAFLQQDGHYVVVGLGASGLSAVCYLHQLGFLVSVMDANESPALAAQLPKDVTCVFGAFDEALLCAATGIVISPGVNPAHPAIVKAKATGVPVVSDVQLCIDECHARQIPIVAITGSNAKSTVTTLVGEMAKTAGVPVGVGGNLGVPALELLKLPMQLCVLELSSFQLEHISHLNAQAATLLNLSADHLDRHGDMHTYLQAKLAVFDGAKTAVLLADDKQLATQCQLYLNQHTKADVVMVGSQAPVAACAFGIVKDDGVLYLAQADKKLLSANDLLIKWVHNVVNALFALALGQAVELPMTAMLDTLRTFKGLPHRCEYVATVDNRAYFNDSKGTNIGSTMAALTGLGEVYGEKSLALIVGGQGKGQDFSELAPLLERYVHTLLTIGEDAPKITQELQKANLTTPIVACHTLEKAVTTASTLAVSVVLLSPACASFDQFRGFPHRGEVFVSLVHQLIND